MKVNIHKAERTIYGAVKNTEHLSYLDNNDKITIIPIAQDLQCLGCNRNHICHCFYND